VGTADGRRRRSVAKGVDARPCGILGSVEKEDGLAFGGGDRSAGCHARGRVPGGEWLTDRASVVDFPFGSFDAFFQASLSLNEKGRAAQAAFDSLSADNAEATCVGRPTPGAVISSGGYVLEIDLSQQEKVIVFRSEGFSEVRTIYMDGRGHPTPSERLATGHSIGHWDGDTLVVDTTNVSYQRTPYQIGVPSGGQNHVVERYRLTEDGTHIDFNMVLEDSEYLTEPMSHDRELNHSPHLEMFCPSVIRRQPVDFL